MTTEIIESWYTSLVDELQDIITEKRFEHTTALIECYHMVGTRILQENDNFERAKIYGDHILQRLAISLGRSQRTLAYAVKFAKTYPELNLLPEGKNWTWHHIINKYLTDGIEKKVIKKADLYKMIKEIKELLNRELQQELQSVNNGEIAINKSNVEFIRYLQDQVNKITGELNKS
uniref:Uncharacterized protein n=1 Tax=viral metagenome TaxID=1070528 RepID=A0A6M3IQ15_9ZZZZ